MEFEKTEIKTMDMKPFEKIGSQWMLIALKKMEK